MKMSYIMTPLEKEYIKNTQNMSLKYVKKEIKRLTELEIEKLKESESNYIRYHMDIIFGSRENKLTRNIKKICEIYNVEDKGKTVFERLSNCYLQIDYPNYEYGVLIFPLDIWNIIVSYCDPLQKLKIRCVGKFFLNIRLCTEAKFILNTVNMSKRDLNNHIKILPQGELMELSKSKTPFIVNSLQHLSCYVDTSKEKNCDEILESHGKKKISKKNSWLKYNLLYPSESEIVDHQAYLTSKKIDFTYFIDKYKYIVRNKLNFIIRCRECDYDYEKLSLDEIKFLDQQ